MNFKYSMLAGALIAGAFCLPASATSLVAEHDGRGGVSFEFVADPASPVAALGIELPLREAAKGAKVAEDCFQAPRGFSALCNIDGLTFKAVLYSTNPDAAIPSASLGRVQFPQGSISLAKSGEVEGLALKAFDGMAQAVQSEVLSAPKGADSARRSQQER